MDESDKGENVSQRIKQNEAVPTQRNGFHEDNEEKESSLLRARQPSQSSSTVRGQDSGAENTLCRFCAPLLTLNRFLRPRHHHPTISSITASALKCPLCEMILTLMTERCSEDTIRLFAEHGTSTNPITVSSSWFQSNRRMETLKEGSKELSVCFPTNLDNRTHRVSFSLVLALYQDIPRVSPLCRALWQHEDKSQFEARLSTITEWLQDCRKTHSACQLRDFQLPELPTRVIDVGDNIYQTDVRLLISLGRRSDYLALSHCWGTNQVVKTTNESIKEHTNSISMGKLPKTFQDAILITRKLGFRYLWIDSLCIVQDDAEDWRRESSKMASVYGNSTLTIAATASSSSEGGCLYNSSPTLSVLYRSKNWRLRPSDNVRGFILSAPLTQRAWVLQETNLSRRVVHCWKSQFVWECSSRFTSEDGMCDVRTDTLGEEINIWCNLRAVLHNDAYGPIHWAAAWCKLVVDYTRRKMSFSGDKFAAIAGLSKYFEKTGDIPLAGLWRNGLFLHLLWQVSGPSNATCELPNIPSWSWAKVEGPVEFPQVALFPENRILHSRVLVLDASVEWTGLPLTSTIKTSRLVLQARILEANIQLNEETPHVWKLSTVGNAEGSCRLDFPSSSNKSVFCLEVMFQERDKKPEFNVPYVHILVLELTAKDKNEYKRIGAGSIVSNKYLEEELERIELVAISLI